MRLVEKHETVGPGHGRLDWPQPGSIPAKEQPRTKHRQGAENHRWARRVGWSPRRHAAAQSDHVKR